MGLPEPTPPDTGAFDPPAYGMGTTARRLVQVWREERRLSLIGLGYAFVYSVLSLAIPLLIATAIDSSIVDHRYPLAPLLAAIAALSVIRAWVNYQRRYATSRVGIAIEARLRELLYQAYLRFPRPFYDRQPTGQVLSRATNDLYPVRYFIGWGLVQAVQSSMLIVGTAVLLALTNWQLALWSALPMPMIAVVARRFGHLVTPVSRTVQARKGDLTDAANEAVVGIEMVQAFGRGQIVRDRFAERAGAIRTEMLRQARRRGHLSAADLLPALTVGRAGAVPRRALGDRRHDELRGSGPVHPAAAPARLAAGVDRLDPRPQPASARLRRAHLLLAGPDRRCCPSRRRRRRPGGRGTGPRSSSSTTSSLRMPRGPRCCAACG